MAQTSIKLDRRFYQQARGMFEKYNFVVGALENTPHKRALPKKEGLKSFHGGQARKTGRVIDGTVQGVSESVRARTGINLYQAPFRSRKNRDILRFSKAFFDLVAGRTQRKRAENLLQAIVRNPILRGDYGGNSPSTTKRKGFSRLFIDTGQLFRAIKARTVVRRVS